MPFNGIKNIVFEGGGVKGLAYIGALESLEKTEVINSIKRVGGTSAGAIAALLVGLGISSSKMKEFLNENDIRTLEDDDVGGIRDTIRLLTDYGWNKGEKVREWIGKAIVHATEDINVTFRDIKKMQEKGKKYKDMYFVGTNLSTHSFEFYCYELTPDTKLIDAVQISMSIPLFYPPKTDEEENYYVDGGVLMNYPIRLFDEEDFIDKLYEEAFFRKLNETLIPPEYTEANKDLLEVGTVVNKEAKKKSKTIITNITGSKYIPNPETLGFRLDSQDEINLFYKKEVVVNEINNFHDFTKSLIRTLKEYQNHTHLNDIDIKRTIFLDVTGVKATDFDITPEKKEELIFKANEATTEYLKNKGVLVQR
ncbi:patatin-like phospholipase family protein [Clostridium tagluense]|uniref:patatin-like phospholipase family protein n=1 Tax=Clostridium tagluense TaxID=360422 RepID=UPI001C0BAF2F|nr:patatin-like phospholipase family protein [Clostridium tagluense]MBU3130601.1 patatin-like phospholipase family protein [Clostridium tagluense]